MKYVKPLLAIAIAVIAHWLLFFEAQAAWKVFVMLLILGVYLYGTLSLARHLSRAMIPGEVEQKQSFKERLSQNKANAVAPDSALKRQLKKQKNTFIVLGVILSVGIASAYFMYLDRWKKHEIETHYVEQLVVVKSIWHRKSRYVEFKYVYNNISYEDRTQNRWLNVGDTLKIAFSSRNPRIMEVKSYP